MRGTDILGVEQGNDRDRSDIVENGKRGQKASDCSLPLTPYEGEDANDESGIGGHRYAPATDCRRARIECRVDQRRHQHTAECGDDDRESTSDVLEFADQDLALDLEPEYEEEQHHQAVVHPLL